MPVIYHNNNASTDSFDDMFISNADDSIVLSDLIRTGETSRLRRRGAMRMEPTSSSIRSSRSGHWRSTHQPDDEVLTWTSANRRSSRRDPRHMPMLEISDDDYEYADSDSEDEMVFSDSFNRVISDQTGEHNSHQGVSGQPIETDSSSEKSRSYTLLCGGPSSDIHIGHRGSSSEYPALARYILPQSVPSGQKTTPREYEETNGCGSVVHLSAFPRHHQQHAIWMAGSAPTDVVIPLERIYFEDALEREGLSKKLLRQEACGCLRIGLGCANCGNALGFQLSPCKAYRSYLSSKEHSHHYQSRTSSNDCSTPKLYTFLPSSVRARGEEKFPVVKRSQRARNWSQPRVFADVPFIPPPPPLIPLPSDSELSDSDEEIVIDFRTPTRILDHNFSLSPEPVIIDLDSEYSNSSRDSLVPSLSHHNSLHPERPSNMQDELNEARASWANVVRGVQAAASSMGNAFDDWGGETPISPVSTRPPAFRPQRRDAYAPSFEEQFQAWFDARTPLPRSPTLTVPHEDEYQIGVLTPPPPAPHELPPSTLGRGVSGPYETTWNSPVRDEVYPASYWMRPTDRRQWTWTNDWQTDVEAESVDEPETEWGDGPGVNSTDEKSENGETSAALWTVDW